MTKNAYFPPNLATFANSKERQNPPPDIMKMNNFNIKTYFLVTVVPHVEMKYFTNYIPSVLFLISSSAIFISILILPILLSSFSISSFFVFHSLTELHINTVQLSLKLISILSFCFPFAHFAGKRRRLPTLDSSSCPPSSHGSIFENNLLSIHQQCGPHIM